MSKYTGDFETVTWLENETYVWAWALCEIDTENIEYGNCIETFIEKCKELKNPIIFFQNLKFDGEFIIWWLLKNGFKHVEKKEEVENNTFTTLISDMGQFYNIEVYFKKGNKKVKKVTFIDSLKIIPFSVDRTAKSFGMDINKLKIDYNLPRKKGHILTNDEKEYIKNDVLIMARALKIIFDEGLTKNTRASNALDDFKKTLGSKSKFMHYFPPLEFELDKELRKSYKGGFTYLNPIYKEKDIKNINVLDVNSLYPYVMYSKKLPIGEPIFFKGKYEDDKIYDLYIQTFSCCFEIKENKIPTIQLKNRGLFFSENEYLTSSEGEVVSMTLTCVDLKLFLEQYNVYDLEYEKGWKFRSFDKIFKKYIDKWIEKKIDAGKHGNLGQRQIAKLMLNSLYGKLATSLETRSKIPYLGDDKIVHYKLSEKEKKKGIYLPAGAFITSYAREKTIRTSQAIKDYSLNKYGKDLYIYSDTDSIHTLLSIDELKQFCEIDAYKLGCWAHEAFATRGRFIRQKSYIEEINGEIKITCSGLPSRCYDKVTWNNFKIGFSCDGKLTFKHIIGGVKLVETEFTIKEQKLKKNIKNFDKK